MTPTNPELDALQAMVESEGWRQFLAHIEQEWGAVGFAGKIASTIGTMTDTPELALAQLQQAAVAQKAVLTVKDWPQRQIAYLKRANVLPPEERNMSRRGPGL